jgi:hypothetical protein
MAQKGNIGYYGLDHKEVLARINKSDPLGKLIAISEGKSIPGMGAPTGTQIYDAVVRLVNKVVPDLRAIDITASEGTPNEEVSIETLERLSRIISQASSTKATRPDSQD